MTKYQSIQRYLILFLTIAALALALHSPGEISVDSGRQLHEAAVGYSLSWNPPFMSAWLRFLGRGAVASALFIFVNALATYLSFSVIMGCLTADKPKALWRIAACLAFFASPLFFYYVGIVWKDVLIGTALITLAASLIGATVSEGWWRRCWLVLAILLSTLLPMMRQQGMLIAPVFVALGAYLLVRDLRLSKKVRVSLFLFIVVCSFGVYTAEQTWVSHSIKDSANRDISSGLNAIMAYDVAGIIANTPENEILDISGASPEIVNHLRQGYSSQRIDKMMADPVIAGYFNKLPRSEMRGSWLEAIKSHPMAYIRHKVAAFSWLLGMHDIQQCVPVYVGKYTLPDDAAFAEGQESYDDRARLLNRNEIVMKNTPIFRNWFYVLLLIIASFVIIRKGRGDGKLVLGGILVASWIYLLSFLPTSIACDVRYLYPVGALSTIGFVGILLDYGLGVRNVDSGLSRQ